MYVKRNYGFWMTLKWSKTPLILGVLYSLIINLASYLLNFHIAIPWQPISIIGIAVAFYLGFKNNSSYDRTWEARKIWGSIVNNSRSFGASITSFVQGPNADKVQKELIYRHIAWLITLRYQLRLAKPWEHKDQRIEKMFEASLCSAYSNKLEEEISKYLSNEELDTYAGASNQATQILRKQSERLQEFKDQNYFEDFRHMEFHHLIVSFYEDQGKSERIKSFPFPRQYASTALWLTIVFSVLVPLGISDVLGDIKSPLFWITPILSGLIIWIFFLMEKIGDYSENPFEGTYNDVPITAISRTIEIDLREMINDDDIPVPTPEVNGFLL